MESLHNLITGCIEQIALADLDVIDGRAVEAAGQIQVGQLDVERVADGGDDGPHAVAVGVVRQRVVRRHDHSAAAHHSSAAAS